MFHLYRIITVHFFPILYLYLLIRRNKGKEDKVRFSERLGKTKILRPDGILVWVHAASVGEAVSMLPLCGRKKLRLLWTQLSTSWRGHTPLIVKQRFLRGKKACSRSSVDVDINRPFGFVSSSEKKVVSK